MSGLAHGHPRPPSAGGQDTRVPLPPRQPQGHCYSALGKMHSTAGSRPEPIGNQKNTEPLGECALQAASLTSDLEVEEEGTESHPWLMEEAQVGEGEPMPATDSPDLMQPDWG